MTKSELIQALQGLDDRTEIRIFDDSKEKEILLVQYVPSKGEEYAYMRLMAHVLGPLSVRDIQIMNDVRDSMFKEHA